MIYFGNKITFYLMSFRENFLFLFMMHLYEAFKALFFTFDIITPNFCDKICEMECIKSEYVYIAV